MSHYNMLVFPAIVLPLVGVLKLDMPQVLGLSFWQYLLFGLMALPWGVAGDRFGAKGLTLVMFLGSGLSGLAAAIFMESPRALSLALAGTGLFSAIYHPIGLGLISKGVRRISVAMGYNAVFGGLGLAVAPLVTGVAVWVSGPKASLFVLAGMNFLGLVLLVLVPLEESPVRQKEASDGDNGMLGAFLILLVAVMLGGIAFTGGTLILPTYLELRGHGILEALASLSGKSLSGNLVATSVTTVIYAVGMLGQYVGGHAGDRYECKYSYLVFHAACIPFAFLMVFAQDFFLMVVAGLYFFFLLGMQAIENTLVARLSPKRWHHSAYGLKFVFTFGVGALGVKMIQGIDSLWGIQSIFYAFGTISVLIVISILFLIRWINRFQVETDRVREKERYPIGV
jgi:MFS family permease